MNKQILKLYKPYEHQEVIHTAITKHITTTKRFSSEFQKIFVVKACRQVGKSAMAINELLRFAFNYTKSISGYIAPTLKLSKKTFEELLKMLDGSNLVRKSNGTDLIIELVNGSVIYFFSGEQRDNLRGFTISGLLVIDEAAFITDDIYNECISPWTDAQKAVTLIISTPKFKIGFFYELYIKGLSADWPSIESFDFTDYDLSIVRSPEKLEEKKLTCSKQTFKSEYLGMFLEGDGEIFVYDDCIYPGTDDFKYLYFGLDWGSGVGADYTVLTALNENKEQIAIWKWNDIPPNEQIIKISEILFKYKQFIKCVNAESNSIGRIYLDYLKKATPGINIKPFTMTNDSKRKLVEKLQVALQNGAIKLLNDKEQNLQLSFYEATINPKTNSTSYNAKVGYHDDCVVALMLALDASTISNYRFSALKI